MKDHEELALEMINYDKIMITFPLYVDGMPGLVKNFFECLIKYKDQLRGKNVTRIIHSGFSEGIQLRGLERCSGKIRGYKYVLGYVAQEKQGL